MFLVQTNNKYKKKIITNKFVISFTTTFEKLLLNFCFYKTYFLNIIFRPIHCGSSTRSCADLYPWCSTAKSFAPELCPDSGFLRDRTSS